MLLKYLRLSIVLLLILSGSSIIILQNQKLNILLPIFVLLLYFFHFQTKSKYNIKIPISLIFFTCFVIAFVNIAHILYLEANYSFYYGLIIKIISVLFFLLYYKTKYNSFQKLSKDIYIVLKFILFLAFLNIFIIYFFNSFFVFKDDVVKVNTIYGIFNYISFIDIKGYAIYRNQGLFWEPGVLQVFINILLYVSLFIYRSPKISILSVLVIISTFSTTGILIMAIILSTYVLKGKSLKYKLFGLLMTLMVFMPLAVYGLYDKFTGDSALSASLRMYDFYLGFQIFLDNILIGIGFNADLYLELQENVSQNFLSLEDARGNTNGILTIGIYFGVLMFVYIYMLFKQSIFENQYLIFIVLFLALFSEPLSLTPFVLMLVLSALFKNNLNCSQNIICLIRK